MKIDIKKKKLEAEKKILSREKEILAKAEREAKAGCDENYQLKFGEKIALEILDGLEPSAKLKELKKEFEKEEKISLRKIEEAKEQLKKTKKELLEYKEKNTWVIESLSTLGNQQLQLNKNLDSTNKNIIVRIGMTVERGEGR